MPSNKITNEKQQLIDGILRKQSSSNRRTTLVPSQPGQSLPNQLTLHSGDIPDPEAIIVKGHSSNTDHPRALFIYKKTKI